MTTKIPDPKARIKEARIMTNIANVYTEPPKAEDFADHMGIWLKANGAMRIEVIRQAAGGAKPTTETWDMTGEHVRIHVKGPNGAEMNQVLHLGKIGHFANWSYSLPQHSPREGVWTVDVTFETQSQELAKVIGKSVVMKSAKFDIPKYKP